MIGKVVSEEGNVFGEIISFIKDFLFNDIDVWYGLVRFMLVMYSYRSVVVVLLRLFIVIVIGIVVGEWVGRIYLIFLDEFCVREILEIVLILYDIMFKFVEKFL